MPELVDNAGVREQARKEQERRDAVNELGTLSKCLAGYLGCFDDTKTHAEPDSELVKLLEAGCKSALKRLGEGCTLPLRLGSATVEALNTALEKLRQERAITTDITPHDQVFDIYPDIGGAMSNLEQVDSDKDWNYTKLRKANLELASALLIQYEATFVPGAVRDPDDSPGKLRSVKRKRTS